MTSLSSASSSPTALTSATTIRRSMRSKAQEQLSSRTFGSVLEILTSKCSFYVQSLYSLALLSPYRMIQFFKSQVYLEIEDEYQDVLDDIKLLKENYMLVKQNLGTPAEFFRQIAQKLYDRLESA